MSTSFAAPVPLPPERPPEFGVVVPAEDAASDKSQADPAGTDVPLPLPRPPELGGVSPPAVSTESSSPALTDSCVEDLTKAGAVIEAVPPLAQGGCGIAAPVRLSALPDGVTLKPAAVLNCAVARTLLDFVGKDVAMAARERLSGRITTVAVATSYDCRPQNHISGAKMSEHGLGNAVDIAGFILAGGRTVTIGDTRADEASAGFVADIRKASCARFTTVLGPGSDSEHGNHLHLDLRQRSRGYRICQ